LESWAWGEKGGEKFLKIAGIANSFLFNPKCFFNKYKSLI